MEHEAADIAIVGAGPVGLALAAALEGTRWRVVLIDRASHDAALADPRALAVAEGGRQLLARLGAWPALAATPIREIHVSQQAGFGRTLIRSEECRVAALGHVIRYGALSAALAARVAPACMRIVGTVDACTADEAGAVLSLRTDAGSPLQRLSARLVVHAEGAGAPAETEVRDYSQHAIVAEVEPDRPHAHRAWERFTPDGPAALLPLGHAYSLVLAVDSNALADTLTLDDAAFLAALERRFGGRLRFATTSPRQAFPLARRLRRHTVGPRQVWIGNAAQTLHPVAGQGFNLGLRDACVLAETLAETLGDHPHSRDDDPGLPARLAAFARRRRLDRATVAGFTDGLVRLFSNDSAPLRLARGLGLLAVDLSPPLRLAIARRMIWGARAWP